MCQMSLLASLFRFGNLKSDRICITSGSCGWESLIYITENIQVCPDWLPSSSHDYGLQKNFSRDIRSVQFILDTWPSFVAHLFAVENIRKLRKKKTIVTARILELTVVIEFGRTRFIESRIKDANSDFVNFKFVVLIRSSLFNTVFCVQKSFKFSWLFFQSRRPWIRIIQGHCSGVLKPKYVQLKIWQQPWNVRILSRTKSERSLPRSNLKTIYRYLYHNILFKPHKVVRTSVWNS